MVLYADMGSKMKVIVPAAGIGARMWPLTKDMPKILLDCFGRPLIYEIIDSVSAVINDPEFIFVVNTKFREMICEYVRKIYPYDNPHVYYPVQETPLGFGHAVLQARQYFEDYEPGLVLVGDAVFDFMHIDTTHPWVSARHKDDPRQSATIEMDGEYIKEIIEKPDNPTTTYASTGAFFFTNIRELFEMLATNVMVHKQTKGEFQLIDGIQGLVHNGTKFKTYNIPSIGIEDAIRGRKIDWRNQY